MFALVFEPPCSMRSFHKIHLNYAAQPPQWWLLLLLSLYMQMFAYTNFLVCAREVEGSGSANIER